MCRTKAATAKHLSLGWEDAVRCHKQTYLVLEFCLEPDPFRAGFRAVRTLLPADGDDLKVSRRRGRASAMSDVDCKCDRIWTRLGDKCMRDSLDWVSLQ